jgi:hypothetical protein
MAEEADAARQMAGSLRLDTADLLSPFLRVPLEAMRPLVAEIVAKRTEITPELLDALVAKAVKALCDHHKANGRKHPPKSSE